MPAGASIISKAYRVPIVTTKIYITVICNATDNVSQILTLYYDFVIVLLFFTFFHFLADYY